MGKFFNNLENLLGYLSITYIMFHDKTTVNFWWDGFFATYTLVMMALSVGGDQGYR